MNKFEKGLLPASMIEPGMIVFLDDPTGHHLSVVRTTESFEVEANGVPAKVVVLGTQGGVPIVREAEDLLWIRTA